MPEVTLLHIEGCPNWRRTAQHLHRLEEELGLTVRLQVIGTPQQAARVGFVGSPTVLLEGVDPFATGDEPVGLACRLYATPHGLEGSPTLDQLRDALR